MKEKTSVKIPENLCCFLRTKGWYVSGQKEILRRPSKGHHFWCNKTLGVIGPDDDLVDIKLCHSERSCYRLEPPPIKMA